MKTIRYYAFVFLAGSLSLHAHNPLVEMLHMMEEMDQMFDQMATRSYQSNMSVPDYKISVSEKENNAVIAVTLGKHITSDTISVEVDNDILYVTVAGPQQVELKVTEQQVMMSIFAQAHREPTTDDKQGARMRSTCMSQSSQMMTLPTRVDFIRHVPQADFADGVLTLTLAKKGSYKVPVHVAAPAADTRDHEIIERHFPHSPAVVKTMADTSSDFEQSEK